MGDTKVKVDERYIVENLIPKGSQYLIDDIFGDSRNEVVFVKETPDGNTLHVAFRPPDIKEGFGIKKVEKLDGCDELDFIMLKDDDNDGSLDLTIHCNGYYTPSIFWYNKEQILKKLFPGKPDVQKRFR